MIIVPKYYLVHETPQGARYAYPRSLVESVTQKAVTFSREATVTVAEPAGAEFALTKTWLIADAPLVELRRETPGPRRQDGWMKRSAPLVDGPVSPDLRRAFDAAPERPTEGEIEHLAEHDAAHVCWQCQVLLITYQPHSVDGEPVITAERFDDWAPLPGEIDPIPDRGWQVDDPSLLAIYGDHTAHLWPGRLDGLRKEVGLRLSEHPLVTKFYDFHGNRAGQQHHGFSITVSIPWETPRTKTTMVTPPGRRKPQPRVETVWAMRQDVQLDVPVGVAAPTKAEALALFEDAVQEQMARFLPFGDDPKACDHCSGTGRV
jgi:hypothetical protein